MDLEGKEHLEAVKCLQAAEVSYRSADPWAARPHLERALKLDPGLSRASELMGMMELLRGDLGAAIESMGSVRSKDRAFTEAGKVLSFIGSLSLSQGGSELERAAIIGALGQTFLSAGMMEASAVCFRALEDLTEPGWQVHSLLGFTYRQMDLLEVSLRYYDRALDSGGPKDELLFDRAMVLVRLGRLDEAAEAFRRFSEGPKGSAQSWNDLGAVLEAQGRLDEAMAAYDRAVELDPDYYIALYSKGKLLQKRGSMEEARPVLQRALDLESRVFDINDIRSSKEAPEEGTVKVKQVMRRGTASQ